MILIEQNRKFRNSFPRPSYLSFSDFLYGAYVGSNRYAVKVRGSLANWRGPV
jgi:hypothetical protein